MLPARTPQDLLRYCSKPDSENSIEQLYAAIEKIEKDRPEAGQEIHVLKLYWGLTDKGPLTLATIAQYLEIRYSRAMSLRRSAEVLLTVHCLE